MMKISCPSPYFQVRFSDYQQFQAEAFMAQTIAIEKNITTFNQLQAKFNLRRSDNQQFFHEWFNGLSQPTDSEKQALDGIKQQYFYQRADGPLAEGAVKMVIQRKLKGVFSVSPPQPTLRCFANSQTHWTGD